MNTSKQTIALCWQAARKYPHLLFPLLAIVPVNVVLGDFIAPYIVSHVLQRIIRGDFDATAIWASFSNDITLFLATIIASGIIGWRLIIWLIWKLEMNVVRDLSQKVFDHLMDMSPNFHANRFSGSLVSQANKLTGAYIRLADSAVFNILTLITAMITAIAILAPRAPVYALVLTVLSALYLSGTMYFARAVREANTVEAEAQSRQTGYLADSITNILAVKSFSAGEYEKRRYWGVASETRSATHESMRRTTIRETYASTITTSINVAALMIAIWAAGSQRIDVATIYLMVAYTGSISHRLWEFQHVLRQYNRAMGDASDMVKILAIEPGIKDPARPKKLHAAKGTITFDHVTFTHPGRSKDESLFNDMHLHIKPGEKIGLVGPSGSGKTTFTRLLLRFSDIDSGKILIDGQDIAIARQDDVRRAISYVPQEPLLFHRTIRENIAYGKPGASDDEIRHACRAAHALEFVDSLPEGLDTLVGERGVKLSGGQRQRIAIARAMLKNAPILLLDEATSALDSESEKLIQDALWKLMEGRTAIVIAHRLSTIQKMDRIIVLDHGTIVEEGSHTELLRRGGVYAALWAHQSGGFIED